jgi:hypothetical protein
MVVFYVRDRCRQNRCAVNNASRTRDLDDFRSLLIAQRYRLDLAEVREYFALFDRSEMLDDLLAEIADENR